MMAIESGVVTTGSNPVVSGVTVTRTNDGSCPAPPNHNPTVSAQVTITWSIANPDTTNYSQNLYRNGVLYLSSASSGVVYNYSGYVEVGGYPYLNTNDTFRVDVVRLADNVVVSTASSAAFMHQYSTCNGS